jgi:hypothetical protein
MIAISSTLITSVVLYGLGVMFCGKAIDYRIAEGREQAQRLVGFALLEELLLFFRVSDPSFPSGFFRTPSCADTGNGGQRPSFAFNHFRDRREQAQRVLAVPYPTISFRGYVPVFP